MAILILLNINVCGFAQPYAIVTPFALALPTGKEIGQNAVGPARGEEMH